MKYLICMIASVLVMCGCGSSENKGRYAAGGGDNVSGHSTADAGGGGGDGMPGSMGFLCKTPWGITEDGFAAFSGDFVKDNMRSDGFAYLCGMKLKSDGIGGMFDKDNHLTGIRIEFSDFVIGEAPDYSGEERRKIREKMLRNNENIRRLISSVTEVYGEYSRCSFDDGDTDFYFTDGEDTLAEWVSDKGMMSLKYSNRSGGTGCRMSLVLERREQGGH